MLACYAVTLFLSAALLFSVQLILAKMVLPLLGGTPAVWNTCMVFFQAALLAGYSYAHALPRLLSQRRQALVQAGLLALALLAFPLGVRGWVPPSGADPSLWLLTLLLCTVGLPFFAVSATAPLLQKWFSGTAHPAARDPYFLYGASNLGSMAALLSYPVLVEPNVGLHAQSVAWMAGYGLLLVLTLACAALAWRSPAPAPLEQKKLPEDKPHRPSAARGKKKEMPWPAAGPREDSRPMLDWTRSGWLRRLRWVALAFVPSSLVLGVTTYITTDIASVPLFWVLPLAVYLLTFILVFSRLPPLVHQAMVLLLPAVILLYLATLSVEAPLKTSEKIQMHLALLFVASMVCHGELARDRPDPRHLTEFYLLLSLGGVLGGAFNALVAPQVFSRVLEYPLMIVAPFLLAPGLGMVQTSRGRLVLTGAFVVFALAVGLYLCGQTGRERGVLVYRERNFFGVLSVHHNPEADVYLLYHGTTLHGAQLRDPTLRKFPLTYFSPTGPIGQFMKEFNPARPSARVAVVGLGAGSMAAYAQQGQQWTFYEIDPPVERIARDTDYFTFLHDAEGRGAEVRVVLGDGRLGLKEAPGEFDLIVLDAFGSDAIPVHILTREAVRVYLDHLAPGGVLAFHISSLNLFLYPVVANLAADAGLDCLIQQQFFVENAPELQQGKQSSEWVLMARAGGGLRKLAPDRRWKPLGPQPGFALWTDDFSNLFSVINWDGRPKYAR